MVLLNSRIISLEETQLTYQFVNASLDRIRWVMLNVWDTLLWRSASHVFIRLILPVFFFEAVSCTKNVEHEWIKLNMNDNNGQIRLVMKKTFKLYKDTYFICKILYLKKLGFNFFADWRSMCLKLSYMPEICVNVQNIDYQWG